MEPTHDPDKQKRLTGMSKGFAGEFQELGADALVVLMTDDANAAKAFAQSAPDVQVALLSGGLGNPLVNQYGIAWADHVPNVLLVRPDGTIAWKVSGLDYRYESRQGPDLPIKYAISHNLEKIRCDAGFEALERGDYKAALKHFEEFEPLQADADHWVNDRRHGRTLAYMALKDCDSALKEVDVAIEARTKGARGGLCKCHGVVEMYLTKASILEELGRSAEAKVARELADREQIPHAKWAAGEAFRLGVPVGVYYDWLKEIRLNLEKAE